MLHCIIRSLSFLCVLLCYRVSLGWRRWSHITHTAHCCSLMPRTGTLTRRTCAVCFTLRESDQHYYQAQNGCLHLFLCFCILICAPVYVSSAPFSEHPNKCHYFHNHKGHCYVTAPFLVPSLTFLAKGIKPNKLFLHWWCFFQTHCITSALHASLWGQGCSSCFGASLICQKRQLVGAANTNNQITLSQLGAHCRQKRNILFLPLPLVEDVQKSHFRI